MREPIIVLSAAITVTIHSITKMLPHIATLTVLLNIAIIELDSFYSFSPTDVDPLPMQITIRLDLFSGQSMEMKCKSPEVEPEAIRKRNRVIINTSISSYDSITVYDYWKSRMRPDATLDMYENLFKSPLHRVFVYGTLKRGEPNHSIIKDAANGYAKFLGAGRTTLMYPLVIATKYNIPFLLKKPGVGNHVLGEIYDVDSKMLKRLDELEEHPTFYERIENEILLASEAVLKPGRTFDEVGELTKAWIYFLPRYNPSLLERPMYASYSNSNSHGLKYCEKYVRDPSYDHRKEVQ